MEFTSTFWRISSPKIVGAFVFTTFSIAFVMSYIGVAYLQYLKTYKILQIQEIEAINQKAESTFKNLKQLLQLTGSRIDAVSQKYSIENSNTIREILNSLPYLQPPTTRLPLQKIAFYKLSEPQMIITRLGILPFVINQVPLEEMLSQNRNSVFILTNKPMMTAQLITGRMNVMNSRDTLEGIVEIQIDLSEFIKFLGIYETIELNQPLSLASSHASLKPLSPIPLPIYSKLPDSFWVYTLTHQPHYSVFTVYALFSLILIGFCLRYTNRYFQRHYRHKIETLENNLLTIRKAEIILRTELGKSQKDNEFHQVSCQVQKTLQNNLRDKQKVQAQHIIGFLDDMQFFKPSLASLIGEERIINMDLCLNQSLALSKGLWHPTNLDDIDLKEIFDKFLLLFAEKIHQSNITFEMPTSLNTPLLKGDPLLMELLIANVVGKSIYRVPDNGTVSISLKIAKDFLHLEIQDSGYERISLAESLIQKSCDFFIEEEVFQNLCRENGLYTKYSKASNGCNVAHMIIPLPSKEEVSKYNVVQLFK